MNWTGAVNFVAPELASVFAIGDPASGSFQIDSAIADANPSPSIGEYPGAATAIFFRFGSFRATVNSGDVLTVDAIGDGFIVRLPNFGVPLEGVLPIEGIPVESMGFGIEGGPGGLSGDEIPLSLDLANFSAGGGWIHTLGSAALVRSTVLSLSYVVPEPSTAALLALGLVVLGLRRRV